MKSSLTCLLIFSVILSLTACQHGKHRQVLPATFEGSEALDTIVLEGMENEFYPGGVLIVGQPGKILHAKAYGRKTFDPNSEPVTLDTIYDMASVTKVVGTATAAWLLIEDGTIGLDDRVADYIDGFDAGGKDQVTIRDLMTHVSGLKAYENRNVVEQGRFEGELPADALIRHYAALEASYTPRERYVYSCLNFQTLARVVEEASGKRVENLLQDRVWNHLGMRDTHYVIPTQKIARIAPTHRRADGTFSTWQVHDPLANYHGSDLHCPGNAGLFSTAPDLARYCEMILQRGFHGGKQVFSPRTIDLAASVQTPDEVGTERGLGWVIYRSRPWTTELHDAQDSLVVGHTGYTGTMIWLDRLSGTYFVFLTNRTFPAAEGASDQTPNITPVRRRIADTILRSLPDYQEYFQTAGEVTETGG